MHAAAAEPVALSVGAGELVDEDVEGVVSCAGNLDGFAPLLLEGLEVWV